MKTIQEYLKNCDRKKIINGFIYDHAFQPYLMGKKYREVTLGEYIGQYKDNLNRYIDRLVSIEPKPVDEDIWILMAVHTAETELGDIDYVLVKQSEVMDETLEYVTSYAYGFTPHEAAVGFLVADTYLTQYYIDELLVDFLYEASFTGYEQEELKDTLDKFEQAKNEIEDGTAKTISFGEMLKQVEDEFGYVPEKHDPSEEAAWKKWLEGSTEYYKTCKEIEVRKLREMIMMESSDSENADGKVHSENAGEQEERHKSIKRQYEEYYQCRYEDIDFRDDPDCPEIDWGENVGNEIW